MPRHRYAAPPAAAPTTSLVEVAAYALLGSLVAAGVLLTAGQPSWQAGVLVAAAFVFFATCVALSRRRPAASTVRYAKHIRARPR